VTLQGGSFDGKRRHRRRRPALSDALAMRVNGVFEDSGSFRDTSAGALGIAPTVTLRRGDATKVRSVSSTSTTSAPPTAASPRSRAARPTCRSRPTTATRRQQGARGPSTSGSALVEHNLGGLSLRNRTLFGDYDRSYQNYVPGAVSADGSSVTLTAYNNATQRRNLFNQTDLTYAWLTGRVRHNLLFGAEVGRQ
jgi:catecholate siderophore receptor